MLQVYSNVKSSSISFKQANVNIMAFSDTHGDLNSIAPLYQNFKDNKNDIFIKKDDKSTLNLMALVGDWFMNPSQKSYLSDKDKTSGDYQAMFLNSFIKKAKAIIPSLKVLYTPGNHCLDGGAKVLVNHIKNQDMDTIISNANLEEASLMKGLSKEQREKIQEYKILEVEDDKNPNIKHKVLAMGIVPVNIDFFVKEDLKGLNILGSKNCQESDLTEHDADETAKVISIITDKFKEENPNSAVVLMSHSGEPIAKAIAKKVCNIDLILNAHDHLDKVSYVYNQNGPITKIISLSQNAKKLEAVKLHFDDEGKLSIKTQPYYTNFEPSQETNPFEQMYNNLLKKDLTPLSKIVDPFERKVLSSKNIRYNNNDLANFCTDAIYKEVAKTHPETQVFMISSTTFREDLPTSKTRAINNIDIMNLFKGIVGDLSKVMVGNIKGDALAKYICANVVENFASPDRNAINQYSGVIIDRANIGEMIKNDPSITKTNTKDLFKFIKIRSEDGEFDTIDPEKNYNIALPRKLFVKSNTPEFKSFEKSFTNTEIMACDYFRDYITNGPDEIILPLDTRIIN